MGDLDLTVVKYGVEAGWTVAVSDECTLGDGFCDTLESAKLAAVEAWRRWARETAEAAGFVVTDPVEPEVGGDG